MFKDKANLIMEILALREQVAVLLDSKKRPKLTNQDRLFWIILSRIYSGWQSCLAIVKPATVIHWHRYFFKLYWRWKSRKQGRPEITPEMKKLIKQLSKENPQWSAERIRDSLLIYRFAQIPHPDTIRKYMVKPKHPRKPSGTWLSFLHNHRPQSWAIDFFTVHTLTFNVLYVFVVLDHGRRKVVHFAVTAHPSLSWIIQQLREAMPFGLQPRYMFRDNDKKYGNLLKAFLESCGIDDVPTAYRSPWQNPYVERFIGTLRQDLLNHVIIINERHLHSLLKEYINDYYHIARPHQGLNGQTPENIPLSKIKGNQKSNLIPFPVCGGLHHRYERVAA